MSSVCRPVTLQDIYQARRRIAPLGGKVAVVLSGGNIDGNLFFDICRKTA